MSLAFCFSIAFADFAFLAFSLSCSRFFRTSPAEEFLWMTYVDTNVRDEQRGDSPGCPVPMGHGLPLEDAPHFVYFEC
jgi:hypothetical protein